MAVREILTYPDSRLRARNAPVEDFSEELRSLVRDLFETTYSYDGVGVAAPQVGVNRKLAVVAWEDKKLVLANPRILLQEGEEEREEGCLSFPGIFENIKRPQKVTVEAMDEEGKLYTIEAEGFLARALLHEIDHLEGKLFIDHLSPMKRQLVKKKMKRQRRDE
ncbi:MAG: peptide deformylase [Synergistaceae bacterium]|nr:peptide deformylase [Synergistaceae bacterium]HAF50782.1 peptide deformylase [Synergistaceae bacterium]HHV52801.1 peptide deformylase [Synergistaceae bacterium]